MKPSPTPCVRQGRRVFLVLLLCGVDFLLGAGYIRYRSAQGTLLHLADAKGRFLPLLWQSLVPCLFPLVLLLLFAWRLKKGFAKAFSLELKGKWQRVAALILTLGLLVIAGYALLVKENKAAVLFALPYYLLCIAFTEEFVVRGVCVHLLQESPWSIRYLVPNACFALMHLFLYANWGPVTLPLLLRFMTTTFLGYVAGGCLFQMLKEKSGTLWLPILLHGLMDFSAVLRY